MRIPPTQNIKFIWLTCLLFLGISKPFLLDAQDAKWIDSLYNVLQKSKEDTSKVLILCDLTEQLAELDSSKALGYARAALTLSQQLQYSYGEGFATHMIGYVYDCSYNPSIAIQYYQKSLIIKEKNGDISGISASLVNIGLVNYYQNNYDKALEYYDKAIEKRRQIGDSLGVASIYNNMAVVHRRLKNYDQALDLYLRSLKIKEKSKDEKGIANAFSNLSTLFQYKEEYDIALDYEEKALEIEKKQQNLRGIAHSLMSIGHIFYWKENYTQAAEKIREAIFWADSAAAYDVMARGYGSLSEIDSLLGNISLAFSDYKNYILYKDLISKEKEKERTAVLQTIYETEKKEHALERSKKENEILEQQNALQVQTIRFWILLTLAAVALLGLLFNYNRIKQKNYAILQEKNKEIANALKEKELLLKEIHHRVKNNLQVVSGLLHWQSQQSDDEAMKKTVREGKNRLKSMAMIHQRLYQEDNLKAISIQEYVQELTAELLNSYGLDKQQIEIKTAIDPIFLDVDTMVPLGLIMTELITNAIKHAFPNQVGQIEIGVKQQAETLHLTIADNGIGGSFDEESKPEQQHNKKNFGLILVKTLAQKLDAQLFIAKKAGTEITLVIHKFKIHHA